MSQLADLKIKTIKKEFQILFSRYLNVKKARINTLVLNFFFSNLE